MYIHTQEMLKQYSKEILYRRLPFPPCKQTLFVELVQFTPGTPEDSTLTNGSSSRASVHGNSNHTHSPSSSSQLANTSRSSGIPIHAPSANHVFSVSSSASSSNANHSTSPWSRWGTVSTPSRPPSTQRRQVPTEHPPRSNGDIQPMSHSSSSRKRKHLDEGPSTSSSPFNHHYRQQSDEHTRSSSKRRAVPVSLPPPAPTSPPMRPIQTLSPSLAMIMSPTNQSVQVSPRNNLLPPIRNNGHANGSPILPPVQSLIPPGSS